MDDTATTSIWRCFSTLRDPRTSRRQKKHRLLDIVAIALCAVIAGADDWPQIAAFGRKRQQWLGTFLSLTNGIPSRSTFERVFAGLSPRALQSCLLRWLDGCARHLDLSQLAIDGKTLRHSGNAALGLGPLHLVSVWASKANLSLGQVAVDQKSNEITAIPLLLQLLDLKGALVTIDAMGCQKDIARQVVEAGGDYVLTVKENHPGLYDDILQTFLTAQEVDFQGYRHDSYRTEDRGHGRKELRCYTVLYDLDGIAQREQWERLTVIGMCYSERTVGDETTDELRLFIGSRDAGAKVYGDALRGHWGIENGLHWHLDVTFGEDACRVQQRNTAQNLGLFRKWALSLLKQHPDKSSVAVKRFQGALDPQFLQEILNGRKNGHLGMRWPWEQDLVLASGVVEGAARYVIGERLDQSGMRWIVERAEAVLQLRCIEVNGDWDAFFAWAEEQRRAELGQGKAVQIASQTPTQLPELSEAAERARRRRKGKAAA